MRALALLSLGLATQANGHMADIGVTRDFWFFLACLLFVASAVVAINTSKEKR